MLDFNVDRISFDVVVAQQKLVDQLYQQGAQMQMQPVDPNQQPVQQQNVGGQE